MTKLEVQQRVLKDGKPLPLDDFEWDEETNTFSSAEGGLVLDFTDISGCTFKTGSYCTFKTDWSCTFKTGSYCTFDTGSDCTFNTGSDCTFDTGWSCTFNTGDSCVIVRRDIYEVIEIPEGREIKLRNEEQLGWDFV